MDKKNKAWIGIIIGIVIGPFLFKVIFTEILINSVSTNCHPDQYPLINGWVGGKDPRIDVCLEYKHKEVLDYYGKYNSLEGCKNASLKILCVTVLAVKIQDTQICRTREIPGFDEGAESFCIEQLALDQRNVSLCDSIPDTTCKSECKDQILDLQRANEAYPSYYNLIYHPASDLCRGFAKKEVWTVIPQTHSGLYRRANIPP